MSLQVKHAEGRCKPLFVCDHCDKQIEDAYLANVEWRRENSAELFYLHKSCSRDFCEGKRLEWMSLTDFLVFLQNNAGFCRPSMIDKRSFKSTPIQVIKDLVIEEVSLVDRPANPGSEVLVFKKDDYDFNKLDDLSVEKTTAAKRDAALIERLKKMGDEVEEIKALSQKTTETYKRIKRGRKVNMTTIEEVTQATLDGEFSDKLKAWAAVEKVLRSKVSKSTTGADFNQTLLMAMTQPSWNEFYDAYAGLPEARVELKEAEVRKVGTAEAEINKRAQEMLDKGLVKTFSKGVVRVVEIYPELEQQHRRELYG